MEISEVMKSLIASRQSVIEKSITTFYNGLVEYERRKLPESIFIQTVLPLITTDVSEEKRIEILRYWLSVAGSYLADISIVNENGDEIFILPSILDGNVVNRLKNGETLHGIVTKGILLSNNLPILQERYLLNMLSQKNFATDKESTARNKVFVTIYNRYVKPDVSKRNIISKDSSISDDFIYD